jgi:hypothetical protein
MASNVTRDHHNLRRNLKLNDNYISNDGGDEGISIADDGDVTMTSNDTQLKVAYNGSNYTTMAIASNGAATITATGGTAADADIGFLAGNGAGSVDFKCNSATFYKSATGLQSISMNVSGEPLMIFNSSADAGDELRIGVGANGASNITTIDDDDNQAAHLTFDIQGDTIFKGDIADGTSTEVFRLDSSASSLFMASGKKIEFGDAGEHISGDGSDLNITSSRHIGMVSGGSFYFDAVNGAYHFRDNADTDDHFKIVTVSGTGATTLETVSDAADGHLTLLSDGDLILNSGTGRFEMHGTGTTAKFADMYAGMILGYTVIGLDETPAKHDVLAVMTVLDDDMKVSFVFPPSGKVEIMASIYVQTDGARPLTFGLSTTNATTGFTTLGAKYENHTFMSDETDGYQHTHRWYVTGTAGDAESLWFAAGCTQAGRYDLYWGGDSSSVADGGHPMEYQPFVMKATALPATINTG